MPMDIANLFPLDRAGTEPYYRQIYRRVVAAIASGVLKPGDRVPSARALTRELGLARGTIDAAYALLAAEGYVISRAQAGTIVTPGLLTRLPVAEVAPRTANRSKPSYRPDSILPFQMGKIWARLGARCARSMHAADMVHPPAPGLASLRAELAAYLHVSRGIACTPQQVFITAGYRHSMQLVCHALLRKGERVWVEDPGYPPTRELLRQMHIEAVAVSVDGDGMVIAQGLTLAPDAAAAVVTPAHQSPLCVTLSLPRRQALLDWASARDAWIIEDDYDGEYRYVSRPLPALKSLDGKERVLYAGTFSKVLFPALRLAYLVVPQAKVERFEQLAHAFAGCPQLTQAITAAFMAEGHFARHIQRMRKLYGERRSTTIAALQHVLGSLVRMDTPPGGMHLILRILNGQSDHALVARMHANGLQGEALSDWTMGAAGTGAVLLNFTNIDSRAQAEALGMRILPLLET
jgi:GntR family transcriptional regulator/MocR family aminotransferase